MADNKVIKQQPPPREVKRIQTGAGSMAMSRSVSSNRLSKPPDRGSMGHSPAREIVQSVFSLASQQPECDMSKKPSGDAELKMDWTEPPTTLNAMGFYSFFPVYEDVMRQPDSVRGASGVLDRRVHEPLSRADRHRERTQISSQRRSRAGRPIRTSRSDVMGGGDSDVSGYHDVLRITGGEAFRANCSMVTI
jgi:hypothetical protein